MLPKKIYLRETELDELFTGERMISFNEPYRDVNVEFTNLSEVWHSASEVPEGEYEIMCQDEFEHHWLTDYRECKDYVNGWADYVADYLIVRWAYISDLLPKGGKK